MYLVPANVNVNKEEYTSDLPNLYYHCAMQIWKIDWIGLQENPIHSFTRIKALSDNWRFFHPSLFSPKFILFSKMFVRCAPLVASFQFSFGINFTSKDPIVFWN